MTADPLAQDIAEADVERIAPLFGLLGVCWTDAARPNVRWPDDYSPDEQKRFRECARTAITAMRPATTRAKREAAVEMRERCAAAAIGFGESHRVVTKKVDGAPRQQFNIYEVERHAKAASRFIAEDIRALPLTGTEETGA